uniref:Uncharacterized protein n=1 Tax=Setaria digitata TaxID=48799 RepID=A0A915PMI5_9BILA
MIQLLSFPTLLLLLLILLIPLLYGNEDAKRLYDDLMVNYNKHRRPAPGPNKPITIRLKLRLSQIIDVHEIDQIMTCSVWLKQVWIDNKLSWNPQIYGGVSVLYVPYEMIWVPDIVLYNNADSNYNITISTKATLRYDGQVTWEPPAIFKTLCQIDVRWFPFDEQQCYFKFGSWTYSENLLNLELLDGKVRYEKEMNENGEMVNITIVDEGIDLSDYYPSVEWDIMSRVAKRRTKNYPTCCPDGTYIDIMFYLELRRKPLFYTVNLVFPCIGISFLTIVAFYLPSRSGEKVTLCILTLVALTVFYLLLTSWFVAERLINYRLKIKKSQLGRERDRTLPKVLLMRRPMIIKNDEAFRKVGHRRGELSENITINRHEQMVKCDACHHANHQINERIQKLYHSPYVIQAFENVCFIAELLKKKDRDAMIDEDWKFVAMVLDRLFLFLFSITCFSGTALILLQAPSLYDTRQAID